MRTERRSSVGDVTGVNPAVVLQDLLARQPSAFRVVGVRNQHAVHHISLHLAHQRTRQACGIGPPPRVRSGGAHLALGAGRQNRVDVQGAGKRSNPARHASTQHRVLQVVGDPEYTGLRDQVQHQGLDLVRGHALHRRLGRHHRQQALTTGSAQCVDHAHFADAVTACRLARRIQRAAELA